MSCVPVPEAFEVNLVWAYRDHGWEGNRIYPLHGIGATFGGAWAEGGSRLGKEALTCPATLVNGNESLCLRQLKGRRELYLVEGASLVSAVGERGESLCSGEMSGLWAWTTSVFLSM